ncbi:DUF2382 domain-containing protein [Herbaspirillum sp. GCM10030257]|uniref:DUF2382 domain-containing protein n=1 Tax=Herbaspirillum sp. GCM10030257 TaxID=3273393 RepID=UPI00361BEB3E
MENTVVGVYDSYAQAQNALNELMAAGFSRSDVQLSPDSESSTRVADTDTSSSGGSGIGNFFRSLFGMEEHREHGDIYSEAVRRGSCVLTVSAASDEQRDRATEIMNRYDPVDIDERSSHWRSQGWSGYDESAPMFTDSEIEKDRALYGQSRTPSSDWTGTSTTSTAGTSADMTSNTTASTAANTTATQNLSGGDTTRIPVVEEELQVGKRQVERGGVRVYQRVRETPVNESVQLREEHVHVERHPVDQPATSADLDAIKEGAIELRETAEEAVVSKTARVVEEVVVGKEVTEQTKDINDTVRRTDVEVEQLGATGNTGMRADSAYRDTAMTSDDSDYRTHWQNAYGQSGGRYEDYDAAYRYGSTMAGSGRYQNARWEDVEPSMRSDWESNHPESAWEKVKDAVRYGAERVTGNQHRQ